MDPRPDTLTQLDDAVIRILAPNPSPMTYWGTNTYVLGTGNARVLIDPGPDDASHRQAILNALPHGTRLSHILVTHAHVDHSAGARALAKETGAPVFAFGDAQAGRAAHMDALARNGLLAGGEGLDHSFVPDERVPHNTVLDTPAGAIKALHTPGHMGNHLCFGFRDTVFSGDLVMGWSSSLISPPDGDAAAFRDSCALLMTHAPAQLLPGHGAPVKAPRERIQFLLLHRGAREAQILRALADTPMDLTTLTRAVYTDLPHSHLPIAARNTLAHLIDLEQQNRISATPKLSETATFSVR
ncbi:MBL fold metallo-hydrolase [Celeribacter baekdonensis]|uniref:MBL fold metallo-hydrolase n=1 Tax=Celeribacter baekdonensis TaxID=875171 RepID=A0A2R4M1G3_9RHOB|nr:MBL fold metallo-hydrolase [Celeribacter baekdonensis]AVW90902.1 MBL fold metallo-hydrolase [Celeribacter baekdonensis]